MIDLSSIYRNPRLPQGYYSCKVTDIDTEEIGLNRPRIRVTLKVGPMHEEVGTILHSIIHATDAAIYWFKNFVSTFAIRSNRYHEAIGRWGCVQVFNAKHVKTKYSAIKYIYQPLPIRMRSHEIAQDEQRGMLDWGEHEGNAVAVSGPSHDKHHAAEPQRKKTNNRRGAQGVPMIDFG